MNAQGDGHDEAPAGKEDVDDLDGGPDRSRDDSAAKTPGAGERPAILQESRFTLEEGTVYRTLRTGAIWMNKLFFSSLFLLFLWLTLGATGQVPYGCADTITVTDGANGTAEEAGVKCSVWLSPTAKYLGAMTVFSFLLSIAFGMIGLVVGKDVVAMTPTREEPGAEHEQGPGAEQGPGDGSVDDDEPPDEGDDGPP